MTNPSSIRIVVRLIAAALAAEMMLFAISSANLSPAAKAQELPAPAAGTFMDIGAPLYAVGNSALAWGDYDNDGDLDLALTGRNSGGSTAAIYRNDGGAFNDILAPLPSLVVWKINFAMVGFSGLTGCDSVAHLLRQGLGDEPCQIASPANSS